jgi:hypothetical protein
MSSRALNLFEWQQRLWAPDLMWCCSSLCELMSIVIHSFRTAALERCTEVRVVAVAVFTPALALYAQDAQHG